jgi:hypothetical protein
MTHFQAQMTGVQRMFRGDSTAIPERLAQQGDRTCDGLVVRKAVAIAVADHKTVAKRRSRFRPITPGRSSANAGTSTGQ